MRAQLRGFVVLAAGAGLVGCATQQATAQALTIAGAAAVVLGASMAADEHCHQAGPGEGGVSGYCAPGLSRGARGVGKGLAVAGVGLAASGYALRPKGPDRLHPPVASPSPTAPYRLIRHEPPAAEAAAPSAPEAGGACAPGAPPPPEEAAGEPACLGPGRAAPSEPEAPAALE